MKRPLCIALLLLLVSPAPAAQAQDGIRIVSERFESQFPEALYFYIEAESQSRIVEIILFYRARGQHGPSVAPLEFDPATHVQANHRWSTQGSTVPPGLPVDSS